MPKILAKLTRDHPQGGAKSKTGRLNADEVAENCVFRREVLSSYCGRKFVTLSVHLHVRQDAARRAGLPATAYPCYGRPIGQAILFWSCGFFYLSSFFFSSPQRSQIGCLPYFHTWCGLSANLECRSEMCCTRLAENTGRQKFAICTPSHNFVGLCRPN